MEYVLGWNFFITETIIDSMVLPGTCPTDGILIEFEIRSQFAVLWFKICSTNHRKILHMSQQCYCRDMCKILLWSAKYVMNKSITKFD